MGRDIIYCPICGLKFDVPVDEVELRFSYWICECCGCEYGYTDTPEYRQKWLEGGAKWFEERARPKEWNLGEQLKNILADWNR